MKPERLGSKLRSVRASRDLTLDKVSSRLGVTPSYLSEIERGNKIPSLKVLCNLTRYLDLPRDFFRDVLEDPGDEVMSFGQMLESRREGLGLTIDDLARAIGWPATYIEIAESGDKKVPEKFVRDLAEELQLPGYFFESSAPEAIGKKVKFFRTNEGLTQEKLAEALREIGSEDPTIIFEYSRELKQLLLSGQGELHFAVTEWKLNHIYNIEIEYLEPRIPYRETIQRKADASYRHKKQSGGAGQFGEVYLRIEPHADGMPDPTDLNVRGKEEVMLDWGGKLVFYNCIVGGVIDARYIPSILKGIMEKMEEGPITGSYVRDIRVMVYDGKMHPVDSNDISFKIAGAQAFREAFIKADPKILEPVYELEVMVPEDLMGDVMTDLQSRRSMILGMDSKDGYKIIKSKTPLAEMHKYSTSLRSITQGRAYFKSTFAEYAAVPGDIQQRLIKQAKQEED